MAELLGGTGFPSVSDCQEHCQRCIQGVSSQITIPNGSLLNEIRLDPDRVKVKPIFDSVLEEEEIKIE